jgi:hypothetical protein
VAWPRIAGAAIIGGAITGAICGAAYETLPIAAGAEYVLMPTAGPGKPIAGVMPPFARGCDTTRPELSAACALFGERSTKDVGA